MLTHFTSLVLLLATTAFIGCSPKEDHDAVTSVWESRKLLADGREFQWQAGGQSQEGSNLYRVLVIRYYATPGRERLIMKDGVTYSSADPPPEMKGSASVLHAWPPDSTKSGLQVEGVKQKLEPGLNVVLISNLTKPLQFIIPANEANSFMERFQKDEWDDFFTSKILPNLSEWPEADKLYGKEEMATPRKPSE